MVLDLNVIAGGMEKMLRRPLGDDVALLDAYVHASGQIRADQGRSRRSS
jgi:hypothetical protein